MIKGKIIFFIILIGLLNSCGVPSVTEESKEEEPVKKSFSFEPIEVFSSLKLNTKADYLIQIGFSKTKVVELDPKHEKIIYCKNRPSEDYGSLMDVEFGRIRIETINDTIYQIELDSYLTPDQILTSTQVQEAVSLFIEKYGSPDETSSSPSIPRITRQNSGAKIETSSSNAYDYDQEKKWIFPTHTISIEVSYDFKYAASSNNLAKGEIPLEDYCKELSLKERIKNTRVIGDDYIKRDIDEDYMEGFVMKITFYSNYFNQRLRSIGQKEKEFERTNDSIFREDEKRKIK